MKMEDLIGKKVRGFKFEDREFNFNSLMEKHIGEIGTITSHDELGYVIKFDSSHSWMYPADQIEKHLVKEVMKKFKIGDRVQCVEKGVVLKPSALGYRPGKEFVVDFSRKSSDGEYVYFPKDAQGVYECDLILVKELPKSFACTNTNQKLWDKYIKWLDDGFVGDLSKYYGITRYGSKYNDSNMAMFDTILSLEEWDEIVNGTQTKKEETMKNYIITREQLQKIHDVACPIWKELILGYSRRNPFGNTIEFTQEEVDIMFNKSSLSQRAVLANIFGKQTKELDFVSDNINFEVDGISVFGESNKSEYDSFIGLPDTDQYKNSFFLNPDYVWTLDDDVLKVTRKNK